MSITDHKPMPEGEFVRARRVEVFTGADPPILDGRREVGDCRGEFCVELERKPGSATATTNALAMFIWRREARLQSSEADNPGFVPAVVDRPDAVERPPVIATSCHRTGSWRRQRVDLARCGADPPAVAYVYAPDRTTS